jgi:hypothetical protein
MGKQPGRHSGRFCKGRGLSTAAGTFDKNRADIGDGYGSRCQQRDTPLPGSRKPSSGEISQVIYLLTLAVKFGGNGDGDEIARTERSEKRLRLAETI